MPDKPQRGPVVCKCGKPAPYEVVMAGYVWADLCVEHARLWESWLMRRSVRKEPIDV